MVKTERSSSRGSSLGAAGSLTKMDGRWWFGGYTDNDVDIYTEGEELRVFMTQGKQQYTNISQAVRLLR